MPRTPGSKHDKALAASKSAAAQDKSSKSANNQYSGRILSLSSQQNNRKPVFRLYVKGSAVMVRFSEEESADVRCRIRDILMGAYGERLQRDSLPSGKTEQSV